MKIAIIGSRQYENVRKIKNLLTDLKRKFGEFEIEYKEYNPAHTPKNLYSAMSEHYYDKPYHVSQFHHRNNLIAKNCDYMIALIPNGSTANGSESAIKSAQKHEKKVVILS